MWRDGLVALSLANLSLLRIWGRVANYSGAEAFHMKCAPGPPAIVSALLNLLLLWASGWALLALARTRRKWLGRAAKAGLLVLALLALNSIRAVMSGWFPRLRGALLTALGQHLQLAAVAGVAAVVSAVIIAAAPRARRIGVAALLVLSPLAPMALIGAVAHLIEPARYALPVPTLSLRLPAGKSQGRAVWVIFDEWDFRTAFEARPPELKTPNLDRLAEESLFATRAEAPAGETILSIPSLLVGERLVKVTATGPDSLLLQQTGAAAAAAWDARGTVLGRARARGINTAAAGWYLPYCRMLAPVVTACYWCEMARADEPCEDCRTPVARLMAHQARSLFETARFSVFGPSQGFQGFARSYQELADAGLKMAADPDLGLVFLHLPIPHNAGLRVRPDGALAPGTLADCLALVDSTVGRLIDAMQSAGVWQSTHLVLSSDHPLRGTRRPDPRIPFLLRLAGGGAAVQYSNRFNTVVTGELLLRALRGEVADYDAVARWLDSQT